VDGDLNGSRIRRDSIIVVLLSIIGTAAMGLVAWAFNLGVQLSALQAQMIDVKEQVGGLRSSSAIHDNQITINTQRLNELERERK